MVGEPRRAGCAVDCSRSNRRGNAVCGWFSGVFDVQRCANASGERNGGFLRANTAHEGRVRPRVGGAGHAAESVALGLRDLPPCTGTVEFRDVSFAYPGRAPVLAEFNLTVRAGVTVAITGENGAGKSTLMHLLLLFQAPSSGTILIDGVD